VFSLLLLAVDSLVLLTQLVENLDYFLPFVARTEIESKAELGVFLLELIFGHSAPAYNVAFRNDLSLQ
jgi:hypothetical protein